MQYEVFIQEETPRGIFENSFFKRDIIDAVRAACSYAENFCSSSCDASWWTVTVFDKECEGPRVVFTIDKADF